MALTCDWTQIERGLYAAKLNGHQLRLERQKSGGYYDVYMDGSLVDAGSNLNSSKTKAIRHAQGRRAEAQAQAEEQAVEAIPNNVLEHVKEQLTTLAGGTTSTPLVKGHIEYIVHGLVDVNDENIDRVREALKTLRECGAEVEAKQHLEMDFI